MSDKDTEQPFSNPAKDGIEFDPYKARVVEAPVSNWGTLLHFLKGSIGTGILAMPKGFLYTGLILGTFATFITGALCSYGLNLLISTEYLLCKRKRVPYLAYSDAMVYAMEEGPPCLRCMAKLSGFLVNLFLVSYQLGVCCVYIIFVTKNVKVVIDDYNCGVVSLRVLMCIFLILFLAINYVPNLKLFAPLSGVANLLMLFGTAVILYYVFSAFPTTLEHHSYMGDPNKWVMFIGICLFAIESVGVVVSAEYSMEKPQDFGGFTGVLNISLMIVTFLYWFLGFFGYATYASEVESSITLNLPRGSILAETTQIFFVAAILISFGLQCFPAIEIVWNEYIQPRLKETSKRMDLFLQYVLRTFLVVLTFALAMIFGGNLANVISFIGVVCLSMLGFTFPGVMNLCLLYPDGYGRFKWIYYKDVIMSVLGFILLIAGFYVSIEDIVNAGPEAPACPVIFPNTTTN